MQIADVVRLLYVAAPDLSGKPIKVAFQLACDCLLVLGLSPQEAAAAAAAAISQVSPLWSQKRATFEIRRVLDAAFAYRGKYGACPDSADGYMQSVLL